MGKKLLATSLMPSWLETSINVGFPTQVWFSYVLLLIIKETPQEKEKLNRSVLKPHLVTKSIK